MKLEKKRKAIELRKDGKSIKTIAKELNVSKSSVSQWVRHILLTDIQKQILVNNQEKGRGIARAKIGNILHTRALEKRKENQVYGREKAKQSTFDLYMAGCMLYWGEGGKGKRIVFTNSEPEMISFFMNFLRTACNVSDSKIKLCIQAYLNNDLSINDIETFWLKITGLSNFQLTKGYYREVSNSLRHKLPYGTARISVYDINLTQQIFGSIKQFGGIQSDKWL